MLVVYDSLTGNVDRFTRRLNMKRARITKGLIVEEPYILVTYTIGFGDVPESVSDFLSRNAAYMRGVAASGNKVWGSNYGKAAERISEAYDVPLLLKFELGGTDQDARILKEEVKALYERADTKMAEVK